MLPADASNLPLLILLLATGITWAVQTAAETLNIRHQPQIPPAEFRDVLDQQSYQRSLDYATSHARLGLVRSTTLTAVIFLLLLSGGFGSLNSWLHGFGLPPLVTGLSFFALLALGNALLDLPFQVFETFVLEERFDFNRTTASTFVTDKLKALFLACLLGLPLLAALLAFLQQAGFWMWLPAWAVVALFTLVLRFVAPWLILPLFNRYQPLPEGELKTAITEYAKEQGFDLSGVYVMDGSRRSTKSNAFFTGFGKKKRIALFDTLIDRHTTGEILGVLAHEIGHFKKGHIHLQTALGLLQTALFLALLFAVTSSPAILDAFGPDQQGSHLGLLFFLLAFSPLSLLLSIPANALSRVFERQADAHVVRSTGSAQALVSALKKLVKDNKSLLAPHPLYVALNASHPPIVERLHHLRRVEGEHARESG